MARNNDSIRWVNQAMHFVWISGFARDNPNVKGEMLLMQSADMAKAIPIRYSERHRLPMVNTPCEIQCHVIPYRIGDKRFVHLEAVRIKRAGVNATPNMLWKLNAHRAPKSRKDTDYNPFASVVEVREQMKANLGVSDQVVDILLSSEGKGTKSGFQNQVFLSGFIAERAFVPSMDVNLPSYGLLLLAQHKDAERHIPLVVSGRGVDPRYLKTLRSMHPVMLIGQVHVDVVRGADGSVEQRHCSIRVDKNNLNGATASDFQGKAFPDWFYLAMEERVNLRKQLDAVSRKAVVAHLDDKLPEPQIAKSVPVDGSWSDAESVDAL
jgi:hypothetical protein